MWVQTKNEHEEQLSEYVFLVDRAAAGASGFPLGVERGMGQAETMSQTYGLQWMN